MRGHTFIFKPGIWAADGAYWDENNREARAGGESIITHSDDLWLLKSRMNIEGEETPDLENQYEINPFLPNFPSTLWVSFNPSLGKMSGMFTVVRDSILSSFENEDEQFTGFEYFLRIDERTYNNEGAFYKGKRRLSSWALVLGYREA